jgi:aspartate kinase
MKIAPKRNKRHSSYYSEGNDIVVIISALNGITDKILDLCKDIKKIDKNIINDFVDNIETIHTSLIEKVITNSERKSEVLEIIAKLLNEFKEILVGISILGEITPKARDYLVSFGERLSTPIVSFSLMDKGLKSEFFNGKEIGILTDSNYGNAKPLMDTTKLRVRHKIEPLIAKK